MRKILIVNDDGIEAEGLRILARHASNFGKVWIVAPSRQCSAMSQRITIRKKMKLTKVDYGEYVEGAYHLEGMPADCVKIALNYVMKEKPDIILSGMNEGFNTGFDLAYSATVGAAMEGIMGGVPSIAFSCDMPGSYETAEYYLDQVVEELLESIVHLPKNEIYNVNFPGCLVEECKGILRDVKIAPMQVFDDAITVTMEEDGSIYVSEDGARYTADRIPEGTDANGVMNHYITIGRVGLNVLGNIP